MQGDARCGRDDAGSSQVVFCLIDRSPRNSIMPGKPPALSCPHMERSHEQSSLDRTLRRGRNSSHIRRTARRAGGQIRPALADQDVLLCRSSLYGTLKFVNEGPGTAPANSTWQWSFGFPGPAKGTCRLAKPLAPQQWILVSTGHITSIVTTCDVKRVYLLPIHGHWPVVPVCGRK